MRNALPIYAAALALFVSCWVVGCAASTESPAPKPSVSAPVGSAGTGVAMMPMAGRAATAGTGGAACGPDGSGACTPREGGAGTIGGIAGVGGAAGGSAGMGGATGAGGAPARLDPSNPTCFEFRNHGQPVPRDTTKYAVPPGEHYACFHYSVPWNEPVEMVGWQTLYDNQQVLHHWLLYSVPFGSGDGAFEPCIGTHLGQDAQLVAGWAVGGNDVDMPPDVGMRMPGAERTFLLEWHFYNSTATEQLDGSAARVCVLPAGTRTHTGGMTWLGTEDLGGVVGMPAGQQNDYGGTCINDSNGPIHIFRLWPHMHQWGRHMTSVVERANGMTEEVFSKPFDFNYQISYEAGITLMPGDRIRSTCRFQNEALGPVAFGPSSDQEMCYQFAFSYPAGELDNGVPSLVGATNTCW